MKNLQEYRDAIDRVDMQIKELFAQRMDLVEEIAALKMRENKPIFDARREKEKIAMLTAEETEPFLEKGLTELYTQIMAISRKREYQLLTARSMPSAIAYTPVAVLPTEGARVVFQGVEGAYSAEAINRFFDTSIERLHVNTWREAMQAVAEGHADYGVLPIENSTAGVVGDVYDLLLAYQNYIVGEQIVPIDHVLLGIPGASLEEITTVYSHPQGLAQCRDFLESHPNWTNKELLNTAMAAEKIAREHQPFQAAIASRMAGEQYGLTVLQEHLTTVQNATRFIVVSHEAVFRKDAEKISICFGLPHACGTLYNLLSHFIFNDLNLTKIESRPVPERPFEYRFFLDFEGNLQAESVCNALWGIREEAGEFRLLGNY